MLYERQGEMHLAHTVATRQLQEHSVPGFNWNRQYNTAKGPVSHQGWVHQRASHLEQQKCELRGRRADTSGTGWWEWVSVASSGPKAVVGL